VIMPPKSLPPLSLKTRPRLALLETVSFIRSSLPLPQREQERLEQEVQQLLNRELQTHYDILPQKLVDNAIKEFGCTKFTGVPHPDKYVALHFIHRLKTDYLANVTLLLQRTPSDLSKPDATVTATLSLLLTNRYGYLENGGLAAGKAVIGKSGTLLAYRAAMTDAVRESVRCLRSYTPPSGVVRRVLPGGKQIVFLPVQGSSFVTGCQALVIRNQTQIGRVCVTKTEASGVYAEVIRGADFRPGDTVLAYFQITDCWH
jgi:hypothetical protein